MIRIIAANVFAVCLAMPAWADPPPNLETRIAEIRKSTGAPALAISIVENGRTTIANSYGLARADGKEYTNADTIFQIGSVSKAFTAAALAVLVDQGKIKWDDRVIDHMPWFQMHDPWVTREITVRDLLVHRSGLGLGEGDLLLVPRTILPRKEIVRRLRHLPLRTGFRAGYAYDNILYVAAGQLIEEVSGKTWEQFVREYLFVPAGMSTATSDRASRRAQPNRAWPHARLNGPMIGMGDQKVLDDSGRAEFDPDITESAGPAGAVAASAKDMARWIALQLGRGLNAEGKRVYSEAQAREMWRPVVHMPIGQAPEPVALSTPQFNSYALGWMERDYRGHRLLMHSGAVIGAQALIMLIPERNLGFAVMINSDDGEAVLGVAYELLDHYLGLPAYDWASAWQSFVKSRDARAVQILKQQTSAPAKAGPTLPLVRYSGDFRDSWYGPITIAVSDGKLTVDFKQTPGMVGEMTHWQYDTFKVSWRDPLIEPAFMTFSLNSEGDVEQIRLAAVSPLADFSFDFADLDFRKVATRP